MEEEEQTRVMTLAGALGLGQEQRVHFLEVVGGEGVGARHVIGAEGAVVGRKEPAEIVLPDSEISRAHCRLAFRGGDLWVEDLGSTNGTFIDGAQIRTASAVPVGGLLQVGRLTLKYEWRSRREWLQSRELDQDLEKANAYVHALLPEPITDGPILADWLFEPSAKLGGDAFGYGVLPDGRFAVYLIDVSGHGAGAAMHSVAIMNVLRQRAVPGADPGRPAEVLRGLNDMFQMDSHAGMYFTLWYGVFDPESRVLEFASAGHHPAFLVPLDRSEATPLRTRNPMIGAMGAIGYRSDTVTVPPGALIYLFSDGVFEIVTDGGLQWRLQDFLPLILKPPVGGVGESRRLFDEVISIAGSNGLDDDFSMVVLTFG
jgi:serine phosphatase RsbU (regulator of sigma subunit)